MDSDADFIDVLDRAYDNLRSEHEALSLEYGQMIPLGARYHDGWVECGPCDVLKEIDDLLGLTKALPSGA